MIIDKSREYSVPLYLERMNVRKPCLYQIRPGLVTIVLKPIYVYIHTLHHELQWISQSCQCVGELSIVSNEMRRIYHTYILPHPAAPLFLSYILFLSIFCCLNWKRAQRQKLAIVSPVSALFETRHWNRLTSVGWGKITGEDWIEGSSVCFIVIRRTENLGVRWGWWAKKGK
jgi:hypothetical protein